MSSSSLARTVRRRTAVGNAFAVAFATTGLMFAVGTAAASSATPLPDALYEVQIGDHTTDYTAPGDYVAGGEHVTTSNSPSASAKTTVSGTGSARGYIRYSWRLDGPAGGVVPVIVTGKLDVGSSAPSDGQANAAASLLWNSGLFTDSVSLEIDRGGANNSGPTHANPTFSEMVAVGQGGLIILDTYVVSYKGSGMAYADPVFSIDPAFAAVDPNYQSHYAFAFSAGIGNSLGVVDPGTVMAAVPEPSSWALMLAGTIGVGTLARRRSRA